MNVSPADKIAAVDKFKQDILQYMFNNPGKVQNRRDADTVSITDAGRLLVELSKAGVGESRQLVASILSGQQDNSLEYFLQAYYMLYGGRSVDYAETYDRYGRPGGESDRARLKKYLQSFADYLNDDMEGENEPGMFTKKIKKYIKGFSEWLKK